jgi:hypothetical protein
MSTETSGKFRFFPTVDKYYFILPLSAGLSGIIEASTTHPFDRIKTEMQRLTLVKAPSSSLPSAITSIYSNGGMSSFYAGLLPRLVGIVPMRLVYWGTLNTMNRLTIGKEKVVQFLVPGVVAGFAQTCIDNPIEVFKIKLMTGASNIPLGTLYNGFVPCLYRNIMFAITVGISTKTYGKEHPFLAGAVGGFFGSLVSQPFDVVKTELQRHQAIEKTVSSVSSSKGSASVEIIKRKSTFQIMKDVYISGGIKKLWSGVSMRCTLGFANMGIGFLALSHIQDILKAFIK